MATVKFGLQEELNELQAKLLLRTKRKFSKQQILETIYFIGSKNMDQLVDMLIKSKDEIPQKVDNDPLFKWLETIEDGIEDTDSVKEHDVIH